MTKTSKGHRITSPVIDGISDKTEIAVMFSAKMQGLLNSTCNDHARLEVLSEINDSLNQEDMNSCSMSVNTVTDISNLTNPMELFSTQIILSVLLLFCLPF